MHSLIQVIPESQLDLIHGGIIPAVVPILVPILIADLPLIVSIILQATSDLLQEWQEHHPVTPAKPAVIT